MQLPAPCNQFFVFSHGLGDRHQQNDINYTLDLNAGLTQVLSDDTNTYLYGNGRISQFSINNSQLPEYFLGDALGSVRQLTDTAGAVTLSQSYAPYGSVTQSVGDSQSSYGFTNEATDLNGLVYLRARYYNFADGRFISRDTWGGMYSSPQSLNRWNYTEGNPVNFTDPSGRITEKEAPDAERIVNELKIYDVHIKADWSSLYTYFPFLTPTAQKNTNQYSCDWIDGYWELDELGEVRKGVIDLARAMGGLNKFISNIGHIDVKKDKTEYMAFYQSGSITVTNRHHRLSRIEMVHELAHAWDHRYNWIISEGMESFTGGYTLYPGLHNGSCAEDSKAAGCNEANYFYGGTPAFVSTGSHFNRKEDFAYSVSAYVYPDDFRNRYQLDTKPYTDPNGIYHFLYYSNFRHTPRWLYIRSWTQSAKRIK